MGGSTNINSSSTTVYLDSYPAPITSDDFNVVSGADIDPTDSPPGAAGIYGDADFAMLMNQGSVDGGVGAGSSISGGMGGVGIDLTSAVSNVMLQNDASVTGGIGGYATGAMGSTGGVGGTAVMSFDDTLMNDGGIVGGNGGNSHVVGGSGGTGVYANGGTVDNSDTIRGGQGGGNGTPAPGSGGTGGVGVVLAGTAMLSIGPDSSIKGGNGGGNYVSPYIPAAFEYKGNGGAGVDIGGSAGVINDGTIRGGTSATGMAGDGVDQSGGTLTNEGTITGGDGVGGGVGLDLTHGMAANFGVIQGGGGTYGYYPAPPSAAAVYVGAGATFDNEFGGVLIATDTSAGVDQAGGTLMNQGHIKGGGEGGTGLDLTHGVATNTGTIYGGNVYETSVGTSAGTGVSIGTGTTLNNRSGNIIGGHSYLGGGSGGTGVGVANDSLTLGGSIAGGSGNLNLGQYAVVEGDPGPGGIGLSADFGSDVSLSEATITGGNGASASGYSSDGGDGGIGVEITGSATQVYIQSVSSVAGGAGGTGGGGTYVGGNGGAGVYLNGGRLQTDGSISGGTGASSGGGAANGVAGDSVQFGMVNGLLIVDPGATFSGYVGGFKIGDTIDITNLTTTQASYSTHARYDALYTPTEGTLDLSGTFTGEHFVFTADGAGGTDVTLEAGAACYVRGTRIRTTRGEVPIERLSIGDEVVTAAGQLRPVRWLGHRRIDCTRYADPTVIWPIRIQAAAFAQGMPARDLWVSPGHAILNDGVLIQAEKLLNGATIEQAPRAAVEYWHVELDSHDVLLAEGLPAESYLDTGNRTAFVNGGSHLDMYPDFKSKHWSDTCAPLVFEGPAIVGAKAALLARAQNLGYESTAENDAHVMVDAARIEPLKLSDTRLAFMLPAGGSAIELRCRSFIPAHIDAASRDRRPLGLCASRLQLDGADIALHDETSLAMGWHELESDAEGHQHRWSEGRVPLPAKTRLIVIDIAGRGHYWAKPAHRHPRAATG